MDRMAIKHRLLDKQQRFIDLARQTGIPYDRLIRIVHGYRTPTSQEVETIEGALELRGQVLDGNPPEAA